MKYIHLLLSCVLSLFVSAQNIDFKSSNFKDDKEGLKKATAVIDAGDDFFKLGEDAVFKVQDFGLNLKKALKNYLQAQTFNPNNALLNYKIGFCYIYSNEVPKAIPYLQTAYKLDPECHPLMLYYYGLSLQLESKYDEALRQYNQFEKTYKDASDFIKFIRLRKEQCAAGKKFEGNPVRVWVDNVTELNTADDDMAPTATTDVSEIIFSSNRSNENPKNEFGESDFDIYSSSLIDGKWSKPTPVKGVNTAKDEIANCLSYDGTKLLLHRDENGQTDIFESRLSGTNWSTPTKMNFNISSEKNNDRYACYSEDGWKMFFGRDNNTTTSGVEILFSGMQNKMKQDYMTAQAIAKICSRFNEGPIYIHIDGETMYIASEGHESIGGYDVFVSKKTAGNWDEPKNLGYPINTPYDDMFFAIGATKKLAYIASNRPGGKGGFDIYKVTFLGPEKKPIFETEDYLLASVASPVKDQNLEKTVEVTKKSLTVFKGITIDAISRKPVESLIEITDNGTGKVIETFTTNSATGKFIITLNSGKNYGIAVKANGYLFHSENFDIPNGSDDNLVNKIIELKNIAVGSKIALRNIFFDVGKATLRPESNAEMDRLVKLMNDVPKLKIEISGHTDNTGSAVLNETLSQQRAEAVVVYLTSKGITANRMTAKGYGSTKPIASNNTEDGKQQNRRTEFEIKGN